MVSNCPIQWQHWKALGKGPIWLLVEFQNGSLQGPMPSVPFIQSQGGCSGRTLTRSKNALQNYKWLPARFISGAFKSKPSQMMMPHGKTTLWRVLASLQPSFGFWGTGPWNPSINSRHWTLCWAWLPLPLKHQTFNFLCRECWLMQKVCFFPGSSSSTPSRFAMLGVPSSGYPQVLLLCGNILAKGAGWINAFPPALTLLPSLTSGFSWPTSGATPNWRKLAKHFTNAWANQSWLNSWIELPGGWMLWQLLKARRPYWCSQHWRQRLAMPGK